ncbi:hypothetical protein Tco_1369638 [Tanacetum coccineum]
MARRPPNWKVVQDVNHKKFSSGGVIVLEDDHDVINFDNSSDLTLSTSLNDLDFATLNIDGQSTDVDAPPDIIDADKDDEFINDEDVLPHDLANFDDEVLANDDDVAVMLVDVARGHGDDDGDDDCPPPYHIFTGCQGREAENPTGPQNIQFEFNDRGTSLPLGDHGAHWSNVLSEIVREFLMHYPSWHKIEPEKKAGVIGTLRPDGTRDVEGIRSRPPPNIKQPDWDKQVDYWLDAKNAARALQNAQNQTKSKVFCRQGSWSLAVIRDMQDEVRNQYVRGDAEARGSRHQYADRCALHRGPDNGHGSPGQAAGAHSRCW